LISASFKIDAMMPNDWALVRAIYLEGIAGRNATFETEAPGWETWTASHLPFARLAARAGEGVIAWAALSPVSTRKCYAGVAEASVYVSQAHMGRGIGKALLRALIASSEQNGIWTLQAAIFPQNQASLALVQSCGFREIGRRERIAQLDGIWRDVVLLERRSAVAGD
jgi:L-amino acid N-acyltransferase YncA